MNRYCPNCQKEFDFTIRSIEDLNHLVCPECGSRIDQNSRKPSEADASENTERAIGGLFAVVFRISYIFFALLSAIGIAAYLLHLEKLLYATTGICLAVFLLQLLMHLCTFKTGILFLPVGAAAGFLLLKSAEGACLGISAVFIIRHFLWELFSHLFGKLLHLTNSD